MHRRYPYTSQSPQPKPAGPRYDAGLMTTLTVPAVTMLLIACAVAASNH